MPARWAGAGASRAGRAARSAARGRQPPSTERVARRNTQPRNSGTRLATSSTTPTSGLALSSMLRSCAGSASSRGSVGPVAYARPPISRAVATSASVGQVRGSMGRLWPHRRWRNRRSGQPRHRAAWVAAAGACLPIGTTDGYSHAMASRPRLLACILAQRQRAATRPPPHSRRGTPCRSLNATWWPDSTRSAAPTRRRPGPRRAC